MNSQSRRSRALSAAALLLAFLALGSAHAEVITGGHFQVTFSGAIWPHALPRQGRGRGRGS